MKTFIIVVLAIAFSVLAYFIGKTVGDAENLSFAKTCLKEAEDISVKNSKLNGDLEYEKMKNADLSKYLYEARLDSDKLRKNYNDIATKYGNYLQQNVMFKAGLKILLEFIDNNDANSQSKIELPDSIPWIRAALSENIHSLMDISTMKEYLTTVKLKGDNKS